MGKEEEPTKDKTPDSSTPPPQPTPEVIDSKEPEKEKKPDVNSLRTVIKVNQEETPKKQEKKDETPPAEKPKEKTTAAMPKPSPPADNAMPEAKSELEQRRNILRSIKDFDFLIKKNQEDISKLMEQVGGLTNDLDDLVSLYEIVSEQMNPFVGLSKVTKKRLDALENFTKEVDEVKTKIGDLESEMEKVKGSVRTGQIFQMAHKPKAPVPPGNDQKTGLKPETPGEKPVAPETSKSSPDSPTPVSPPTIKPDVPPIIPSPTLPVSPVVQNPYVEEFQMISDAELDALFSKSLEALVYEEQIDTMINEFLLSLK